MIIDFGKYSDDEAKEYVTSKPNMSLMLASKFLDKVPNKIHTNAAGWLQDEIAIEGFVFFTVSAVDGLYQEINKCLCNLSEHRVKYKPVVKCLGKNSDAVSIQIKKIIEGVMDKPIWIITEVPGQTPDKWPGKYDRSRSWLWEITQLRNQITHRFLAPRYRAIAYSSTQKDPILDYISLIVANEPHYDAYCKRADGAVMEFKDANNIPLRITEDNPSRYFHACFENVKQMIVQIQKLLDHVPPKDNP